MKKREFKIGDLVILKKNSGYHRDSNDGMIGEILTIGPCIKVRFPKPLLENWSIVEWSIIPSELCHTEASYSKSECICNKEKHGFASHGFWCNLYDEKVDGTGI